jgi:hypothetical protein
LDTIDGNLANDTVEVRDGEADKVTCGGGTDSVVADPVDDVALDCENVDNGLNQAPPGPVGISINAGDQFTNDPKVTLRVVWPKLARTMFVSNDGGFAHAETTPVSREVPWHLDSSGPERLPKTVYARFEGGASGPETYQDDIILDETAPELVEVAVATESSRLVTAKTLKLRIKASDATSGVEEMQITSRKSKPGKWKAFKERVSFGGSKAYVRVRDAAGNASRWKRAR